MKRKIHQNQTMKPLQERNMHVKYVNECSMISGLGNDTLDLFMKERNRTFAAFVKKSMD